MIDSQSPPDEKDPPSLARINMGLGSFKDVPPRGEKKWKSNIFKVFNVFYWVSAIFDPLIALINPGINRSAEETVDDPKHKKSNAILVIGGGVVIVVLAVVIIWALSALLF